MGTMIQQHKLDEAAYRGERFADWPRDLKGCNDLLVLTRPEVIGDIHREFIDAGADIVSTNTFNATSIALADYGLEALVSELNREAAQLARRVADEATARLGRPVFVAGALGPTNRTASISPDVNDPGLPRRHLRSSWWPPTAKPRARSSRAAPTRSSSKPFSTR